ELVTGVVNVKDLHPLCGGNLRQTARAPHSMPHPFGSISDKLHHLRIGGPEQPQVADEQRPDRLGVPKEPIIERQTQAIGLALRIEEVDHQQPGFTPRGRKTMASLRRLAAAVPTPGAHTSPIQAHADPLARRAISERVAGLTRSAIPSASSTG